MRIAEVFSHLGGEEFLIVQHPNIYSEIREIIEAVKTDQLRDSLEETNIEPYESLLNPRLLFGQFKGLFEMRQWQNYPISEESADNFSNIQFADVEYPISSIDPSAFYKDKIASEIQFGRHSLVRLEIFAKALLYYYNRLIDLAVEILPMKSMQSKMSSDISYFEGQVYNVLRHGRSNPAVPLVIIGIEP